MLKALGESCFLHSLSVFTILGTWTRLWRSPESENSTMSTSAGSGLGKACARFISLLGKRSHSIVAAAAEKHPTADFHGCTQITQRKNPKVGLNFHPRSSA